MAPGERAAREEHSIDDCARLKDYLLAIMDEREKRYLQRMDLQDLVVQEAKEVIGVRLHSMNEFRGQAADVQETLARKAEVNIRFDAIESKINLLSSTQALNRGQEKGIGMAWAVVVVLLSLAVSVVGVVVSIVMRH